MTMDSAPPARRLAALLLLAVWTAPLAAHADPFADEVVSFTPGEHAGFGVDGLPGIVLGPPHGTGDLQGSLDVLALGDGGSIVLAFRDGVICDGPGPDFTIFENAFRAGGDGPIFAEVGIVAVSADGVNFVEFPYDASTFAGLAGLTPVYSNPENGIDPTNPAVSGGDSFDLATVGLATATYVRITDPGAAIADPGNRVPPGNSGGFDLDAVAAVHQCVAGPSPTATPSASPTPTAETPVATPSHTRRATPTATLTPTPTFAPGTAPGDANGDGVVDERDREQTIAELFDGDGDDAAAAAGGLVASSPGVDRNRDCRIGAADLL